MFATDLDLPNMLCELHKDAARKLHVMGPWEYTYTLGNLEIHSYCMCGIRLVVTLGAMNVVSVRDALVWPCLGIHEKEYIATLR